MKKFLFVALMAVTASPAFAADVGVSVSVNQPGLYGRIDIGNFPKPQLIYPTAVIIQAAPVGVVRQPLYLHVPHGHAKDWRKHCKKYDACGQPVYFVQESWYNNEYVPRRDGTRGRDKGDDHDHDNGKHKNKDKHKDKGNK